MSPPDIASRLRELLGNSPGDLLAVYLHGSEARGEAREGSDVDLAFLYREPLPKRLDTTHQRLVNRLEDALGRSVDAVVLDGAPSDLVARVLRDGVLVLDRDRSARLRFEVRAWNEYFDMLPILELYRRGGRSAG